MENGRVRPFRVTGILVLLILLPTAGIYSGDKDNTITEPLRYGFRVDPNRWTQYAINVHKGIFYYDTRSVTPKADKVKVWIKWGDPVNGNSEHHKYREITILKEIDCSTRTMRDIEWSAVSLTGTTQKSVGASEWQNIPPESTEEILFGEVCRRTLKGKKK